MILNLGMYSMIAHAHIIKACIPFYTTVGQGHLACLYTTFVKCWWLPCFSYKRKNIIVQIFIILIAFCNGRPVKSGRKTYFVFMIWVQSPTEVSNSVTISKIILKTSHNWGFVLVIVTMPPIIGWCKLDPKLSLKVYPKMKSLS